MPLEQLWSRIRDGQIPSRHEDGFTFVDMAPFGPHLQRPVTPRHLRPPTFTASAKEDDQLSDEEMNSLVRDSAPAEVERAPEDYPEDETASKELGDWRVARRKASRLRVPPPRQRVVT
jgi:hypothetical protein